MKEGPEALEKHEWMRNIMEAALKDTDWKEATETAARQDFPMRLERKRRKSNVYSNVPENIVIKCYRPSLDVASNSEDEMTL